VSFISPFTVRGFCEDRLSERTGVLSGIPCFCFSPPPSCRVKPYENIQIMGLIELLIKILRGEINESHPERENYNINT